MDRQAKQIKWDSNSWHQKNNWSEKLNVIKCVTVAHGNAAGMEKTNIYSYKQHSKFI